MTTEIDLFQPEGEPCSVFATINVDGEVTIWLELDGVDYDLSYFEDLEKKPILVRA